MISYNYYVMIDIMVQTAKLLDHKKKHSHAGSSRIILDIFCTILNKVLRSDGLHTLSSTGRINLVLTQKHTEKQTSTNFGSPSYTLRNKFKQQI